MYQKFSCWKKTRHIMITLNCKMSIWITVEMFPICFWRLVCCNISIGRYSVHLRSPYQVMQQLFCLVFCQWKLRKKRKKKKSRSQLVLSWFRLLRVRKKMLSPLKIRAMWWVGHMQGTGIMLQLSLQEGWPLGWMDGPVSRLHRAGYHTVRGVR